MGYGQLPNEIIYYFKGGWNINCFGGTVKNLEPDLIEMFTMEENA